MNEKLHLLTEVQLLADLSQHDQVECAKEFTWEKYPKDTVLIEKGKKPTAVYILAEGKVDAEGNMWGMVSLITGKEATQTVRTLESSRMLTIQAEAFARILLRWPQIYKTIIRNLADNLEEMNQMLSESRYKEVLRSVIQLTQYKDKFYGIWGSAKTSGEVERFFKKLEQSRGNLLIRGKEEQAGKWWPGMPIKGFLGEKAPFVALEGNIFEQQWGYLLKEETKPKEWEFASFTFTDIAAGGTLFIQEIDQIPPDLQVKLAAILERSKDKLLVIGSIQESTPSNNQVLMPELAACFPHNHFISPLRERKRDVPIIAQGVLEKLAKKASEKSADFDSGSNEAPFIPQLSARECYRTHSGYGARLLLADENIIGLEQIFFGPTAAKLGGKLNLLQWGIIRRILSKGKIVSALQWLSAIMFLLVLGCLLFFPHLSLTRKIFVLVWGLWWPALAIVSPFLGRIWCTLCPFAKIMEFIQDRYHPKRPLPALAIKYDYLLVSALFALIFWLELFTDMRTNMLYTAILLLVIQVLAIVVSIYFPRHSWCRHFCPLGGFIGTASIGSMLEVRADPTVCLNKCTTFDCYVGRKVKGCPMSQHLPYLDNNLDCKLCFRCVCNCQHENVQVNLRIPGREVWHLTRVNQGYVVFIGMLLGILFPILYFQPLHGVWPAGVWKFWFTFTYFLGAFLGGLGGWWLGKPFRTKAASKRIKLVFAFIPLVITGHIIYQIRYIPGFNKLALGIGLLGEGEIKSSLFIPLELAGNIAVVITGIILTAITVGITLYQTRKVKKSA